MRARIGLLLFFVFTAIAQATTQAPIRKIDEGSPTVTDPKELTTLERMFGIAETRWKQPTKNAFDPWDKYIERIHEVTESSTTPASHCSNLSPTPAPIATKDPIASYCHCSLNHPSPALSVQKKTLTERFLGVVDRTETKLTIENDNLLLGLGDLLGVDPANDMGETYAGALSHSIHGSEGTFTLGLETKLFTRYAAPGLNDLFQQSENGDWTINPEWQYTAGGHWKKNGDHYIDFLEVNTLSCSYETAPDSKGTFTRLGAGVEMRTSDSDSSAFAKDHQKLWHENGGAGYQFAYSDRDETEIGMNCQAEIGKEREILNGYCVCKTSIGVDLSTFGLEDSSIVGKGELSVPIGVEPGGNQDLPFANFTTGLQCNQFGSGERDTTIGVGGALNFELSSSCYFRLEMGSIFFAEQSESRYEGMRDNEPIHTLGFSLIVTR